MTHPAVYLPGGLLNRVGEVALLGKTMVTSDGTLTNLGIGAYWALVGCLIFTLVYKLSRYYTPLFFKGYSRMTTLEQRDWDTRLGNIAYSAYIAYWSVKLVMLEGFFWAPGPVPMVKRASAETYAALGVSVGFFLMEMMITIKYWMGGTAMVIHHVGSLLCVLTALWAGDGHCMTLWMLSTEFTTPFIAFRYYLDKAGLRSSSLYVYNGLAILASWTVARLATFPPFFFTVWTNRQQLRLLNPLSIFLLVVFPATLAVLNFFWYTKIVRGALKVLGPRRPKPAAKTE